MSLSVRKHITGKESTSPSSDLVVTSSSVRTRRPCFQNEFGVVWSSSLLHVDLMCLNRDCSTWTLVCEYQFFAIWINNHRSMSSRRMLCCNASIREPGNSRFLCSTWTPRGATWSQSCLASRSMHRVNFPLFFLLSGNYGGGGRAFSLGLDAAGQMACHHRI